MKPKRRRFLGVIAWLLAVIAFLALSSMAVVWASGLRYNSEKRTFEQTCVIAIKGDNSSATVKLNDAIVGSSIPTQIKNLDPGLYHLVVEKPDYYTWREDFHLSAGQVGVVNDLHLIALKPRQTTTASTFNFSPKVTFEVGLTVNNGELLDDGRLVTRLAQTPMQAYRWQDGYLYQTGNQLHLFFTDGPQDFVIYTSPKQSNEVIPISLIPANSQFAVKEDTQVKIISPTVASES